MFLVDNFKKIDDFSKLLASCGYDNSLMELFLMTEDLDKDPEDILTIDNFLEFCLIFNLTPDNIMIRRRGNSRVRSVIESIQK